MFSLKSAPLDQIIRSILLLKLAGRTVGKFPFPGCVNLPRTISGLRGCPCSPPVHVPSSAFQAPDHWLGDRRRCHHTGSNTRGWWSEALGQRPGHLVACEYSEYSCANRIVDICPLWNRQTKLWVRSSMAVVVLQCAIETIEVAFLLNVAIFLAIQVCSGLVYSLAGIVKDGFLTLTLNLVTSTGGEELQFEDTIMWQVQKSHGLTWKSFRGDSRRSKWVGNTGTTPNPQMHQLFFLREKHV